MHAETSMRACALQAEKDGEADQWNVSSVSRYAQWSKIGLT